TCNVPCSNVVTRFRMQCRVQDETDTASLVLCEKDVKSLSDVAVKDTNVPQLDLASVMDDNGTPFELFKSITSTPNNSGSTNKPNGDGMLGDEGSNTKRQ
ncbi:hypothetical protein Tco_0852593, partial [Tanacetum coccineum]